MRVEDCRCRPVASSERNDHDTTDRRIRPGPHRTCRRFPTVLRRLSTLFSSRLRDSSGHFRTLLRLRVTAGGRESHAFLKVFKPQRSTPEELAKLRSYAEREFSATKSLYDAVDTRSGLTALRPVALFAEDMAIVTEEVAGTGFDRVLRDALWGRQTVAPIDAVAERIGAWVRTYQRVIEVEGEISLDERREDLDRAPAEADGRRGPH